MKNKLYEEFAREKFSKEKNYKAIMTKVKEEKDMKSKSLTMKKILNIAAIFVVVIFVGAVSSQIYAKIQWDVKFKEYTNRDYVIAQANLNSDYDQTIDMDYVTQNGIGVKIDSLAITDDTFETKVNFKFDESVKLNSETFMYGIAVYDEDNNIYGINTRMHIGSNEKYDNYLLYMYKELGVKYNKHDVYSIIYSDSSTAGIISAKDRNIISRNTLNSVKGFPKSKKIYIRIFDLGYYMATKMNNEQTYAENFQITNSEWIFEIKVPEKFYERQTTELKIQDEIPGIEIQRFVVTEKGLTLILKQNGVNDVIFAGKDMSIDEWGKARVELLNIKDEDGNIYNENTMSTGREEDVVQYYYTTITKEVLKNKKLFLNVTVGGKHYESEIVEK